MAWGPRGRGAGAEVGKGEEHGALSVPQARDGAHAASAAAHAVVGREQHRQRHEDGGQGAAGHRHVVDGSQAQHANEAQEVPGGAFAQDIVGAEEAADVAVHEGHGRAVKVIRFGGQFSDAVCCLAASYISSCCTGVLYPIVE